LHVEEEISRQLCPSKGRGWVLVFGPHRYDGFDQALAVAISARIHQLVYKRVIQRVFLAGPLCDALRANISAEVRRNSPSLRFIRTTNFDVRVEPADEVRSLGEAKGVAVAGTKLLHRGGGSAREYVHCLRQLDRRSARYELSFHLHRRQEPGESTQRRATHCSIEFVEQDEWTALVPFNTAAAAATAPAMSCGDSN
jgi:hypothetical protein